MHLIQAELYALLLHLYALIFVEQPLTTTLLHSTKILQINDIKNLPEVENNAKPAKAYTNVRKGSRLSGKLFSVTVNLDEIVARPPCFLVLWGPCFTVLWGPCFLVLWEPCFTVLWGRVLPYIESSVLPCFKEPCFTMF